MENIIISIIVPVYNGENCLHKAIESVLCQMNSQLELILVDDGSTDNSGKLLDEYALENPSVHVVHKKNGGLSSARNAGIEVAQGKYISFIDCDDSVVPETYEKIIPVLTKYQPDCLDFGLKYIGQNGEIGYNINQIEKNVLLSRDVIEKVILPPLLNLCKDDAHFIFDFAWNKIYKTEIIKKNDLKYDENRRIWEDRPFLIEYLKYCNNFYSMDKCFYNYVYMPNSLSQRYTTEFFQVIIKNFNHYRELYKDIFDFETQYVCDYWSNSIENMIFRSLNEKENTQEIINIIIKTLSNPQVVHWFEKRTPNNTFQKKLSSYVVDSKLEQAVKLCKKHYLRNQRKQCCLKLINNAKYRIKIVFKK